MVSDAHSSARHVLVAQVLGLAPHDQAKVQAAHPAVIRRATAARHHAVMPRLQVLAPLTAPVPRSEPAPAWVLVLVRGHVLVRQVAQPPAAPVATKQIAHVVRLSSTSNLHVHRLAAPACKIRHHEYSN